MNFLLFIEHDIKQMKEKRLGKIIYAQKTHSMFLLNLTNSSPEEYVQCILTYHPLMHVSNPFNKLFIHFAGGCLLTMQF